jgi:suppressor for copper-sensitivity B
MGFLTMPNRFQFKDPSSDFFKGMFLVLVATSCTGPFLGSALAFSLTQGPLTILLIYLAIGFGFGLPYLVLIIKPELLKLPKAGTWLNKIQFFLSIPLALSSLWFLSLLIRDAAPLFLVTVCLIFLPLIVKSVKWIVIPSIVALGLFSIKSSEVTLDKINLQEVKESIKHGRQVLVTITSDWCITCKVNEKLILNNQEIRKKLDQEGVLIIKGDYTKGSSDLTDYIKSHKRSGVPLNVVYGPKAPQGIVLPVLFSEKELFTALEESKNSKQ